MACRGESRTGGKRTDRNERRVPEAAVGGQLSMGQRKLTVRRVTFSAKQQLRPTTRGNVRTYFIYRDDTHFGSLLSQR